MSSFQTGQFVVYPKHGVGMVKGSEIIEVGGHRGEFLIIEYDRGMTLKIPVERAEEIGLRPTVNEATVKKAFTVLRASPRPQMGLWARRSREIDDKINSGSLIQICQVLRDLTPRNKSEQGLSYSERNYFDTAMIRASREIAAVRKQDEQKVRADMEKALSEQAPMVHNA